MMSERISSQKLTKQVKIFRNFLIASWPYLDQLMEEHDWDEDIDFIDDWLQVNWEMFLERELLEGEVLTPLSVPLFGRVTNRDVKPNYCIAVKIVNKMEDLSGKTIPENSILRLFGLGSFTISGGVGLYPPFDVAELVLDPLKEIFHLPFCMLKFHLEKFDG